ncbi:MAG: hypothetical protein GYA14_10610 [Ignavibacteria bacterium]|nr:hypothetical protein [Ignavibacteria bacterium]
MKFSIIHIESLSGKNAQVYSLHYEGKYAPELQIFVDKFGDSHPNVIQSTIRRIYTISNRDGIQESFFKRESPESHNVFRLLETEWLRIYCIIFGNIILLFGAGDKKRLNTKKNIENPQIEKIVSELMKVEDCIKNKIHDGELILTMDGFLGNLIDITFEG